MSQPNALAFEREPVAGDRPSRLPLSAVVIAKNEADRIVRCVQSLLPLCDEVVVLDSGSSDLTVPLARAAGARVLTHPWLGFAAQKNAVIELARNDWILLLDADEWLGEGAAERIAALFSTGRVHDADVWALERRTRFLGKALRFGGWGRERVERLFLRRFRYGPARVHERLDLAGARVARLPARIEHDTARSESEYRAKLAGYARLFAEQRAAQGKRASRATAYSHAFFHALKNGVLRGGFLDGPRGWRYHRAHIHYVWLKYRLLAALSRAGEQRIPR